MQHKKQAVWLLTLAALSLSGIARAEEASKGSQSFWDKTKVMGQFNTIYSWNFNNPPVGTPATTLTGTLPTPVTAGAPVPVAGALPTGNNALRVFDYRANEFGVNLVDLALENTPNDWAKFRLDLNFGKDVAVVDATKGGVIGVDEIGLQQAYAEFIAPIGKGLTIRAGHFVTLLGYEVIESASNWNTSRSFLFGFAIPFTHTGILATYPVSDQVSASLGIVNGWDLTGDNNKGKTALAQLVYKPTDKITLSAQGTVGPEQGLNNGNVRGIIDFVGTWNVT
ncbi:MAG: outer membrane beta-barrel protein, partial [Deltaproteobacteria bacterium]|nr:outer membrane beta-barrel protein [Deltaproteobacteria bacterium]